MSFSCLPQMGLDVPDEYVTLVSVDEVLDVGQPSLLLWSYLLLRQFVSNVGLLLFKLCLPLLDRLLAHLGLPARLSHRVPVFVEHLEGFTQPLLGPFLIETLSWLVFMVVVSVGQRLK